MLSLLPFLGIWLVRNGLLAEAAGLLQTRPALLALISLVLAPLALLLVLGEGGDRHRRSHARAERWREYARKGSGAQGWDSSNLPAPLSWFGLLTNVPYRQRLRQLSQRRTRPASLRA